MAAVTKSNDGNKAMADEDLPREGDEAAEGPRKEAGSGKPEPVNYRGPQPQKKRAQAGFFTIHKKGQGYWTRMGTAIGIAFIGVMVSFELYSQIPTFLHGTQKHDQRIALIVAIVFLAAYSLWAFWYTNKPSTVDFLIATDSEMKKVNWTTRKELIGSTKVVIVFMFLIAIYLFVCDLIFGGFFQMVHVLRTVFG
jgi:preprotein translocase SecE subunit